MHIPDGFVNAPVALSTGILAAGGVGYAMWHTGRTMPSSRAPMLGLSAAFIFAAQMINFPVVNGTSGHLMGGALAATLIGPSAAVVAMSAVLLVQCLMFADGGITALGANILNMAIFGAVGAYGVYRALCALTGGKYRPACAGVAGWSSTVLASLACAGQVALSGRAAASLIVPTMLFTHILIGIGEGLITAMVVGSLLRVRPHLIEQGDEQQQVRAGPIVVFGLLFCLALAMFVSPFACPWPDGLEKAAHRLGFDSSAMQPLVPGLLPDYQWSAPGSGGWAVAIAGAIGTLVVFALVLLGGRLLALRRAAKAEPIPAGSK